jgi:predicted amidohydrolase YtcJ
MTATVLRGGRVLTCDRAGSVAEAIAISDGRVLAAGGEDEVRVAAGPGAAVAELDGGVVLPGLIDTHPHLMHFGVLAEPCADLSDASDHADVVARIAARAREVSEGEWVMATPVGEPHYFIRRSARDLAEGELPDRHVLDRATERHPVVIQAWAPVTPNTMVLNTAGLERLGIGADTPDQVGNVWIEKGADGLPTGRLHGSVTNYYSNEPFTEGLLAQLPLLDPAAIGPGTERAMGAYNALGVTTVYEGHAMDFPLIEAYRWLHSEGRLSVRVLCCPEAEPYGLPWNEPVSDEEFGARLEQAAGLVSRDDDLLRIDGVTISRGGPCWPGFLLMREPYRGPYGEPSRGVSFVSAERAAQAMEFCQRRGLRLNIVTAGTGEHDEYLDQLEALEGPLSADDRAWLLQHLYFVESEQARRFGALGLEATTSVSFSWGKGELFRERIGEHVLGDLIPLRRLLDAGIRVACGTDWGPKNVFEQIALAAEPRFAGSGAANAGPAQTVTREEALAMWTREAAHVLRWDGIGSLEPGSRADLIVVDRDPLTCALDELPDTKVVATLLGGEAVYGDAQIP